MSNKKNKDKLPELLFKKLNNIYLNKLEDRLIFKENENVYNIFGKYIIYNAEVIHIKTISGDMLQHFYKLKNAVAWCIYERRSKYYDSQKILDLDRKLASLENEITIHKRLAKINKNDDFYVQQLHEDLVQRERVLNELKYYVDESNEWQMKRFNTKI
jgi:hypothetical protein